MTLNEFIDKWLGKKADFDRAYGGQCVDLYRFYVKEVLGFPQSPPVRGASEIYETASTQYYRKVRNTPSGVPEPGDIVIWNNNAGGGFGHVAIFISGNSNSFTSLDQNWPTLSKVTKTTHNYQNVIGWLSPKKEFMPSDGKIEIDKSTFEELVTKSSKFDAFKGAGFENVEQVKNKLDELRNEAKNANDARKQAEEAAEISRKELREFVAILANDQHLKTRQDKAEILSVASRYNTVMGNFEDLSIKYQNDKEAWGMSKAELETEIARLSAMLEYEEVLSNATIEELVRELIKRLKNILGGK